MSYIQIEPVLYKTTSDWLELFLSSSRTRPVYQIDENVFRFNRIAIRVLGVPLDEDEYYNTLFDMSEKDFIHVLNEELDKTIENHVFQEIQDILMIHQEEPKGLSINRLIAFMYGRNLIPKHKDPSINRHVQLSIIKAVKHFEKFQNSGLQSPEFRRFLIDMIKWLKNHWEKWSEALAIGSEFPKVVWYGELSISQKYFLLLLMELGCDILIFHPKGEDLFAEADRENQLSLVYEYSDKGNLEPFPTELRERQTTVAYRANKQLEKMLNDNEAGVYKPWQFRESIPSAITLKTTYDDIFIYAKEKAMIRPSFKIEEDRVYIPAIFAKVKGVSRDRTEYWQRMKELKDYPLALSIREFPYCKTTKANYHFHYQRSLDKQGDLVPGKIITGNWWAYKHLPLGLQKALAHTMKEYCERPKLKKLNHETEYDLQLFLFKQASMIPEEILQLLQRFDYSQEVPRIVLYNMETNGEPSREDAALLLFLNEFGLDIILYNPAGHTDIENYIDSTYYDTHWLEEMVFEQEYQEFQRNEKSLFKKFIKRIF
ncbi:YceG family protein [Metabacillus fastidiosus]|uniref:YceG family protein n=1 Tax=Metabacillus fastidiosus TaxID=1458 RepID=A0ABU6P2Q4_9BACI|nr:YceG family protein [Metabacillus fastidiosus]MED4402932.1 YceG family protein [Metabacillus fastidiosus]MED4461350.1 YceG family protein [Metabacillus fastidiosus]